MLKQFRILSVLLLVCIVPFHILSQTPLNPQIEIHDQGLKSAQVLYFSNFDIFDVGNPQYLFDVEINNIDKDYDNTKIILEIALNNQVVAYAESDYFTLEKPSTGNFWRATNIELINAQTFPGSSMIIEFIKTDLNPPSGSNFEDELYGSGKASTGQYKLRCLLRNDGIPSWQDETFMTLNITNPSNIELSSPGNKVGSGTPMEIMTEFPIFTFFSDGTYNPTTQSGTEYRLYIYEKLSHHYSVEDVINSGNPIYPLDPSNTINTTVLNYATTGGQPLVVGSTYYWFVDVLVPTTAGIETFRSEVYQFKVVNTGGGQNNQAVGSIIEMLRPVVGNQADDLSKTLSNFDLKTIRLNGKTITVYELQQIIENYEGHLIEISELVLY